MLPRMTSDGEILGFNQSKANLRCHSEPRVYLDNEDEVAAILKNIMIAKNSCEDK
jgi:hypothetical protein